MRTDRRGRFLRTGLSTDDAVQRGVRLAERRRRIVSSRIDEMRSYAETTDCRRRLLLGYFGEHVDDPCGYCDSCDAGTTTHDHRPREADRADGERIEHPDFGTGTVLSTEADRMTVLFADHGYKTLPLDAVREHDLLMLAD